MNNYQIKEAILDLTSIVLDIQCHTLCPTHIAMNPQVGSMTITIGYEMERRIDFFNSQFETTLFFYDDWSNDTFYTLYQDVKKSLEKILQNSFVIHE
jgi:hypothetical protein